MSMRIGYGYDSHTFKAGVPLVIGGMSIDHPEGLAGHSDGDVLLHAITDALLGAVSAGDIGTFFPPSDPRWKGAASSVFLQTALEEIATAGYKIVNVDTVLVIAKPKIVPSSATVSPSCLAWSPAKSASRPRRRRASVLTTSHRPTAPCCLRVCSPPNPWAA